ncbi:type VI secretion system Vgr family protein [Sphingomonas bacterium]|uniref:type VI secretion system Vgr family protein n=1 Tax=Sphingomonas bacterium TaxID=1895847 RepID=UPI00157778F7|nr:type VI secretion system tip protein TssI/VgrG [Sphingomonas bacterium]
MAAQSDTRQTQMSIDLGGEQVVLERVAFHEALGQPFELTVDIIATLGEIDLLPHLGKPVTIHALEDDVPMRHFSGFITDGELMHDSGAGFHYRLIARPFTFLLSQNRDMAIFQDVSVPDIIGKIFAAAGQTNFKLQLSKTYAKRTYCVQYRESDWTFITRLMEEEGIYYFFQHDADKHTMIICDAPGAHATGKPAKLQFSQNARLITLAGSAQRGAGVDQWFVHRLTERVSTRGEAQVTVRDFDFEKPERPLQAQAANAKQHPGDAREIYHYPGGFVDEGRGGALSTVRLAALRRDRQSYTGESQAISLATGTKVTVTDHPTGRFNQSYLIVGTHHTITTEQYVSGGHGEDEGTLVTFDAIPAGTPFHLPVATPRPVVQGLETAIVSGPAGEEIYTDEYGRVKVRFHWDRGDTAGEKSTCWIRVAQFGNLGSVVLPRVNQEVMVDFLGGDPDHPIVMGWVFNKGNMPVYDLPANKTKALWRTKRYGETGQYPDAQDLDTGAPGVNELRFEDKGGHEEVFLHAERDMNTRVRFQETHHVGQNQEEKVGHDRHAIVGRDESTEIGRDQNLTVKRDQNEEIKNNRTVKVTGDDELKVTKSQTITVDEEITIEAKKKITLKVGKSTIEMSLEGISVAGLTLKQEAKLQSSSKALLMELKADAINTIGGGLVKIN